MFVELLTGAEGHIHGWLSGSTRGGRQRARETSEPAGVTHLKPPQQTPEDTWGHLRFLLPTGDASARMVFNWWIFEGNAHMRAQL